MSFDILLSYPVLSRLVGYLPLVDALQLRCVSKNFKNSVDSLPVFWRKRVKYFNKTRVEDEIAVQRFEEYQQQKHHDEDELYPFVYKKELQQEIWASQAPVEFLLRGCDTLYLGPRCSENKDLAEFLTHNQKVIAWLTVYCPDERTFMFISTVLRPRSLHLAWLDYVPFDYDWSQFEEILLERNSLEICPLHVEPCTSARVLEHFFDIHRDYAPAIVDSSHVRLLGLHNMHIFVNLAQVWRSTTVVVLRNVTIFEILERTLIFQIRHLVLSCLKLNYTTTITLFSRIDTTFLETLCLINAHGPFLCNNIFPRLRHLFIIVTTPFVVVDIVRILKQTPILEYFFVLTRKPWIYNFSYLHTAIIMRPTLHKIVIASVHLPPCLTTTEKTDARICFETCPLQEERLDNVQFHTAFVRSLLKRVNLTF